MSIRTYNPKVRVGNWNEDICLEEDKVKDFLDKKARGELQTQKSSNLLATILKKTDLETDFDGYLHFGDKVCIHNPSSDSVLAAYMSQSKAHEATCIEGPCDVSGAKSPNPCMRNVFQITSVNDAREADVLMYGQDFCLKTLPGAGGALTLQSDCKSFMKSAKKSREQAVWLSDEVSYHSYWKCLCFDPQMRLETEGTPVPANALLLISHCKTNRNLAAMTDYTFRTPFGREHEIATVTKLNSHKAEDKINHWQFVKTSMDQLDNSSKYIPPQPVEGQTQAPCNEQVTERPLEDNRPVLEGQPPEIPALYGNQPNTQ